jgi:hypothetical protein
LKCKELLERKKRQKKEKKKAQKDGWKSERNLLDKWLSHNKREKKKRKQVL